MKKLLVIFILLLCMSSTVYAKPDYVIVVNSTIQHDFATQMTYITGTIRNTSSFTAHDIQINIELIDKDNKKSYTCDNISVMTANTEYNFKAYVYNFNPIKYNITINYR